MRRFLYYEMEGAFVYDLAVVRGVAASLPNEALRQANQVLIDLERAMQQHLQYTEMLKSLGLKVISIPADDLYPDCVFIEDTAVVVDGVALITIPGHETRRGETVAVKKTLENIKGLTVVEMKEPACMDGGDVLFTGREFFVGMSDRTNQEGLTQLAKAFPQYSVLPISVKEGLHLKSFLSMIGPDKIAISLSSGARKIICEKAKYISKYEFVEFPDDTAANCLYINGNLVHVSQEVSPDSTAIYEGLNVAGKKFALDNSELGKVDGCLTCSSLLIKLNSQ